MAGFKVSLVDLSGNVIAYDDDWQRNGNVISFHGSPRQVLMAGTSRYYHVEAGQFQFREEAPVMWRRVFNAGNIVVFDKFTLTLDDFFIEQIFGSDTGEMKLW
jgi:hypothetical protein